MALTLYRITATDKLVVEDSLTPPVDGVAVTDSPTENLVDKAAWYKALDTDTPLDWTPTIYRTGLPESGTITQTGGTGVNVLNPRYSTFEEATLPPFSTHVSGTLSQDATARYFGTKSLKVVTTGLGGYWKCPTNTTNIQPNKKWIISAYVYSSTTIAAPVWGTAGIYLGVETPSSYVGTAGYDGNAAYGTLTIPANTWTRIYGVLDLTADSNSICSLRIDSHAVATVWFDGIMLEAQVGSLTTPSVYHEPPNFLTTYTGDLDATVGANLLNTYTIPTGTIPTSLTLSTGVNAMTYTYPTGRLDRSGGLGTLSSVNLNTATVATTLSTVALNIITTTVAHGYAQQNCVVYTDNGTAIAGLVSGICYYVIYLTTTTFKLSATIPTATNGTGTAIVLGAVTVGTTYNFNAVDYITTTAAHGYTQQNTMKYIHSSGGTTISGLVFSGNYYLVYLSPTTFALASSTANAGSVSGGVILSLNLGATTVGTTYYFMPYAWYGSSGYSTTSCGQVSFTTVANPLYGAISRYMVGLNRDPALDGGYISLDYAIYIVGGSQLIYESGVNITKTGATNVYTVGDTFSIIYNGANLVNYYRNGILFYSTYLVTPITVPLYMDSAFIEYGSICTALSFRAYVAPVLVTVNNLNGIIHAGNAGDHLSDNIISTATVQPHSISDFQSSVFNLDSTSAVTDLLFQTITFYCGEITITGDKFSKVLVLMGLSNLRKTLTTFPVPVSISVQSQSNIHDTFNPPAISDAFYIQAATPACTATNYENYQKWYKVSAANSGADITYPPSQLYTPAATRQLNVIPTVAGVNITTDVFTCTTIYPVWDTSIYTGMQVIYVNGTVGADIAPLVNGTYYYIIAVSATTFKLATTLANATAGAAINITAVSTGTVAHTFVGGFSWLLQRPGSYFSIGSHEAIANSETKSLTVMDIGNLGDRTQDTFYMYAEFSLANVTSALAFDTIYFASTLAVIVGKR